jgi:hypothetical protein
MLQLLGAGFYIVVVDSLANSSKLTGEQAFRNLTFHKVID